MTLERLWAGWRAEYVGSVAPPGDARECLFCALAKLTEDDVQIVARDDRTFVVLNMFPYTSGHVMVAPNVHEGDLEALGHDDAIALMAMTQRATAAVKAAYAPDGVNVGLNLGRAAGAGIAGHLHVHVLPRWVGDTNFMTALADTRVLPETLGATFDRLRAAWPA